MLKIGSYVTATRSSEKSSMAAPKPLCLVHFTCYQCISISLCYCNELEITSVCTLAIYNPHMLDKRQWRSEEDGMFSRSFPMISVGILFCSTTDNLEITPSLSVYHTCFNHYIVYEIALKGGGSFVQVLFGKIFSFFKMIKYVSLPRTVYGFDNCHLTVYWDPLELKLLREVY